jgi:DinB superfamily
MSALLNEIFEDSRFQLEKVIEGLTEAEVDFKPLPTLMSARETVVHITECCVAAKKHLVGETHDWGTYQPDDTAWHSLTSALWSELSSATESILAAEDEALVIRTLPYLAPHTYYHVGQIAAIRLALNPEWNAYSIYK